MRSENQCVVRRWCLIGDYENLAFVLCEMESHWRLQGLECYKRIPLAALLRIDCRGAGWKQRDQHYSEPGEGK